MDFCVVFWRLTLCVVYKVTFVHLLFWFRKSRKSGNRFLRIESIHRITEYYKHWREMPLEESTNVPDNGRKMPKVEPKHQPSETYQANQKHAAQLRQQHYVRPQPLLIRTSVRRCQDAQKCTLRDSFCDKRPQGEIWMTLGSNPRASTWNIERPLVQ